MHLNRFQELSKPLKASEITFILSEAAGDKYKIQWNQTMLLIAYSLGLKVWQHITKNCI